MTRRTEDLPSAAHRRRGPADALRALAGRAAGRVRSPRSPSGPERLSLNEIGLAAGTDKASNIHDFLGTYEAQLGHLRDQRFKMIEIGVHQGASLRMWEQFFPQARIIGVDINKRCRRFGSDRVKIRIGDQGDPTFVKRLAVNHRPLVIVDDGSHRWQHQIDTFRALWPSLRPGGFFVVEDIHTSFGEDYARTYGTEGGRTAYDYVARIAEGVVAGVRAAPAEDDFEAYCRTTIDSVVMLGESVIIKKRTHPQPWYRLTRVADEAAQPWTRDLGPAYERIPAEVVGASGQVADNLRRLSEGGPVEFEPAVSGELHDVLVHGSGPTVTAGGGILAETLNCAQNVRRSSGLYRPFGDEHWVVERAAPETAYPARTDGKHHVLLKQTWDRNYGHWLIDALPKVGLLDGVLDVSDCVFVVNSQTSDAMKQVVLDSLALAGVEEGQVEFTELGALRFEKLVVLGTTSRHPLTKSPFAIRYLEGLGSQVPADGQRRIYVSRNEYSRRRLQNEDAVLGVLEEHGYQRIHPEQMSLREQIAAFRGAEHVVGNMGAAFSNLAFSPQGVSVLALATEQMNHDFFYDIVCHKAGRYRGLQGAATGTEGIGADFSVDLGLLRECLTWLHAEA